MKQLLPILTIGFLAACQTSAPASSSPGLTGGPEVSRGPAEVSYFGQALWYDPVFDRDVMSVQDAVSGRYGALSDSVEIGMTLPEVTHASPAQADAELKRLAASARDGQDLVVVLLTSHGSRGSLAVLTPTMEEPADMSAARVRAFLAPLENDRQVVILQACHSGSLIPALQSPNRIILAAARADRTSFGCDPAENNTWFVMALTEEMRRGGSWAEIFERTKARVLHYEAEQGVPEDELSHPQAYVGSAMQHVWTGVADPA